MQSGEWVRGYRPDGSLCETVGRAGRASSPFRALFYRDPDLIYLDGNLLGAVGPGGERALLRAVDEENAGHRGVDGRLAALVLSGGRAWPG